MKFKKIFKWLLIIVVLFLAVNLIRQGFNSDRKNRDNNRQSDNQSAINLNKSGKEILIGVEYVINGIAKDFKDLGIPCVKPLPGSFSWDKMQKSSDSPIDFSFTDKYVKEFQATGFTCLIFGLRTNSNLLIDPWMVDKNYPKSQAIDPKYYQQFSTWVKSLVERYDHDGVADLAGLKYPIYHYEIGVEFSSYQPEPTEVYLKSLELGYQAAHEASDKAIIGHSAFLATGPMSKNPGPAEYGKAFRENSLGTAGKGLNDIRKILDRPDVFDVINLHNLGWPYEIEDLVKWISYETSQRNYTKPIIISDTVPTSFAGMGPATVCSGKKLASIFPPAKEADRCRLAEYFKKLINKDEQHLNWLRRYLAADTVQRVVIAADQGIELIDTAFTGDLPGATTALFQAGAGNSGWGGMVDLEYSFFNQPKITGRRPAYYALQQLQENISGYDSITRVKAEDNLRLYKGEKEGKTFFIAWYGYRELYLPDDSLPRKNFNIDLGKDVATLEEMKITPEIVRKNLTTNNGKLNIDLTPEPVYIFLE